MLSIKEKLPVNINEQFFTFFKVDLVLFDAKDLNSRSLYQHRQLYPNMVLIIIT